MRGILTRIARTVDVIDVIVTVGMALLVAGLSMVYVPAALIVPGVLMVAAGGWALLHRPRRR